MALAKFTETMIGSKDLSVTADFYAQFLGMEVSNRGDRKSFLIVADPSIQNALPSIESENLERTLKALSI